MISDQEHVEIRKMYYRDHLTVNAISTLIGRHHSVIKRVLFKNHKKRTTIKQKKYQADFDENKVFLEQKLLEYPNLKASRISQILQDRGVQIPIHQIRCFIKKLRPPATKKAFMKVKVVPGEQAQVDWASCGEINTGRGVQRKLSLFVMVLSFSRAIFARFYLNQTSSSVASGIVQSFQYFGGIPQAVLFDNMKTIVTERFIKAIHFNKDILDLASKYCFLPKVCTPYAAWEKGRVEKLIRYIKENFLAARYFKDLNDANDQLIKWLDEQANKRPWTDDKSKTVWSVWKEEELKTLMPFVDDGFIPYQKVIASVGKTPYVRFDLNNYSIPHRFVRNSVEILGSENKVRIFHGQNEIASHDRSYSKGEDIEDKSHIEDLIKSKLSAQFQASKDHLFYLMPSAEAFFKKISERGYYVPSSFRGLRKLARIYPVEKIEAAMASLIEKDVAAMDSLIYILENESTFEINIEPDFSSRPDLKDIHVKMHDLNTYTQLTENNDERSDDSHE